MANFTRFWKNLRQKSAKTKNLNRGPLKQAVFVLFCFVVAFFCGLSPKLFHSLEFSNLSQQVMSFVVIRLCIPSLKAESSLFDSCVIT